MNVDLYGRRRAYLLFFYVLLIYIYVILYVPFGLGNNDQGFIFGLSYQFYTGGSIYNDIIYIRPPLSIIFHSLSFYPPFNSSPIYWGRVVGVLQIGLYSGLFAYITGRAFGFSSIGVFLISMLSFVVNYHNFPAMPWHTVDGVFFSVIAMAIAFSNTTSFGLLKCFLAVVFALLAALCKQSFYLTPLIVIFFMLLSYPKNKHGVVLLATVFALVFVFFVLSFFVDLHAMVEAISGQASMKDLIFAGFIDYIADWLTYNSIVFSGPVAVVLVLWLINELRGLRWSKRILLFLVMSSAWYCIGFLYFFYSSVGRVGPEDFFDSIFVVTLIVSLVKFFLYRDCRWLVVISMHGIAWGASISWGYKSVALFFAPSILVVAIAYKELAGRTNNGYSGAMFALLAFILAFYFGNQNLYSLEGTVRKSDASVHMGQKFPSLYGIYATQSQLDSFEEVVAISNKLGGEFLVLPNWTFLNIALGSENPIGIDWLLNAEVGSKGEIVKERIEKIDYVLVYREAQPDINLSGGFGSMITSHVIDNWNFKKMDSEFFDVYSNPKLEFLGRSRLQGKVVLTDN